MRRAFSLIELLVVIAIIALLAAILLPALRSAREAGRKGVCMANLQQRGRAHHNYANDFKSFIAIYNGRAEDFFSGPQSTSGGISIVPFPWIDSVTHQIETIVGPFFDQERLMFDRYATSRAFSPPHEHFSHLIFKDYVGSATPVMPGVVCPSDAPRLSWQRSPRDMTTSPFQPGANNYNGGRNLQWWPFSTSYQLMPTAWVRDGHKRNFFYPLRDRQVFLGPSGAHDRYDSYAKANLQWGQRKITEVAFPAQKVAIADSQQRHSGKRDLYYAFPEAVQPVLFWDGSVSTRKTIDSKPGWNPRAASHLEPPATFPYTPDPAFESPMPEGYKSSTVTGYYKWTRGGLLGVDFGGNEISTRGW